MAKKAKKKVGGTCWAVLCFDGGLDIQYLGRDANREHARRFQKLSGEKHRAIRIRWSELPATRRAK